jgi:hypothetical protein
VPYYPLFCAGTCYITPADPQDITFPAGPAYVSIRTDPAPFRLQLFCSASVKSVAQPVLSVKAIVLHDYVLLLQFHRKAGTGALLLLLEKTHCGRLSESPRRNVFLYSSQQKMLIRNSSCAALIRLILRAP